VKGWIRSSAFCRNADVPGSGGSLLKESTRGVFDGVLIPTGQFGLTVNAVIARSFVKGAHEIDRSFVTEDRFLAIHRRGP